MAARSISCPSCGAAHDLVNPGIIMFSCEYCGTAVYWDEEQIKSAGTQAVLPEGFSRLYRGATGSLQQKRFVVMGRVRYSFGHGFWDEWYLDCADGKTRWLTEDNHEFSWQGRIEAHGIDGHDSYTPGCSGEHHRRGALRLPAGPTTTGLRAEADQVPGVRRQPGRQGRALRARGV